MSPELLGAVLLGVVSGIFWLVVRRRAVMHKANRRKVSPWRQSEHYKLFLAGLEAADRAQFFAHTEQEQYKLYMDWTLREGLRADQEQAGESSRLREI
ncbi:MAG: hypothetical protein KGZ64_01235 [Thermaerobacter sp.]|nr:hypothetical protein [Thermaerobacter sp.]